MAWDTAANVISDAALEMGLVTSAISNPYASTDPNVLMLNALLNSFGQMLLRDYQWTHLTEEATFNTSNGTANYDLASDFGRIVNNTMWNRTAQLPLLGPVNPPQWQALKANSSSGIHKVFRIWQDDIWLYPTPTSTQAVYYEYVSKYWVATTGASAPSKEKSTISTDELWFDRQLLVSGLKYYFLRQKKMATQDDLDEYERALARAQGGDGANPLLSMVGSQLTDFRALDEESIPDTGYGS